MNSVSNENNRSSYRRTRSGSSRRPRRDSSRRYSHSRHSEETYERPRKRKINFDEDVSHINVEKFAELGLSDDLLKAIQRKKFSDPTEIQSIAIPFVLAGKDIIASSETGSGKTLAFGAGLIDLIEPGQGVQALVLTPTRELAEQIYSVFDDLSVFKRLSVAKIYGGVAMNPQIFALRKADIVVGTPGRVLDHLSRGNFNVDAIKIFVLDEADRMLDMGFIDDITKIVDALPRERQTLFFSATMPNEIKKLAKKFTKDAEKISMAKYVDPKKLKQVYYNVDEHLKLSLLVHLIKANSGLAMVFCNSRKSVDFVSKVLNEQGLDAVALHGGLTQNRRTMMLDRFHDGKSDVLVCTDVAARGLDIKGVSHVYNYDIPRDSKQYIHRIGRTARAGLEGKAINLLSRRDYDNYDRVLRENNLEIPKEKMPFIKKIFSKFSSSNRDSRDSRDSRNFRGSRNSGNRRFSRKRNDDRNYRN